MELPIKGTKVYSHFRNFRYAELETVHEGLHSSSLNLMWIASVFQIEVHSNSWQGNSTKYLGKSGEQQMLSYVILRWNIAFRYTFYCYFKFRAESSTRMKNMSEAIYVKLDAPTNLVLQYKSFLGWKTTLDLFDSIATTT